MNKEFSSRRFRTDFIISVIVLIVILLCLSRFLDFVEARQGVILNDPVLNLFHPVNLTWLTFGLIYCSLILAIIYLIRNPERLLFAVQLYLLMVIVRIAAMYFVPLNPPAGMIKLKDPFVQVFSSGKVLTKDLFFSGHTATLFILFLVVNKGKLKTLFLIFTIVVAVSVLLQHVHYTIDVFAAPFFTYACYRLLILAKKRFNL
jgi:PAP2 superfamily C-terminal